MYKSMLDAIKTFTKMFSLMKKSLSSADCMFTRFRTIEVQGPHHQNSSSSVLQLTKHYE